MIPCQACVGYSKTATMPDPIPSISHSEYLRMREEQLWRELEQIAPGASDKVRELQGILKSKEVMRTGVVPIEPGPYSHMKNAVDAIRIHLRSKPPFTLTRQELQTQVLQGGWGLLLERRALNVLDSIRTQVAAGSLLEEGGRLALPEQKSSS